jgi:hypothetical protein
MEQFRRSGFVCADTLSLTQPFGRAMLLEGTVACSGNIVIGVYKRLEIVGGITGNPLVQTVQYSYNVSVHGKGNLFRYDNQHPDAPYEGHADEHHRHEFDWQTGDELPHSPVWIGVQKWPTLGEVIEEARAWQATNYSQLPEPDGCVDDIDVLRTLGGQR